MSQPTPQTDPKAWQKFVQQALEKLEKLKAEAENTLMPWTEASFYDIDKTESVREQLLSSGSRCPRGYCPAIRICRQVPDSPDGTLDNAPPSKFMILIWLNQYSDTGVSNGRHYSVEELPTAIKDHQKLVDMYLKTIGGFTLLEDTV